MPRSATGSRLRSLPNGRRRSGPTDSPPAGSRPSGSAVCMSRSRWRSTRRAVARAGRWRCSRASIPRRLTCSTTPRPAASGSSRSCRASWHWSASTRSRARAANTCCSPRSSTACGGAARSSTLGRWCGRSRRRRSNGSGFSTSRISIPPATASNSPANSTRWRPRPASRPGSKAIRSTWAACSGRQPASRGWPSSRSRT